MLTGLKGGGVAILYDSQESISLDVECIDSILSLHVSIPLLQKWQFWLKSSCFGYFSRSMGLDLDDVIIIESDTSYDYIPAQTTSDEGSDHNPFQATSDESSDHNPFQVTSNESSDDTLKSSSQGSSSAEAKKATILSEIVQWYDDLSSDDQRTIYKGRRGSSLNPNQGQNILHPQLEQGQAVQLL
ncbi:hypothetical protein Tco_0430965 [Tanacetum coccineum]